MCPAHVRCLCFLLLSLSVTLRVAAAAMLEVHSVSGADCVLQCTAGHVAGVQYAAVRWYKVSEPPPASRLRGLLTHDLPNGTTRYYVDLEREVELQAESHAVFLPNVTCGDGGVYECHLVAPVGERNQEGQVVLTVTGADCPSAATGRLMTDAYLVIFATAVLMVALVIFLISYSSLKNILRDRNKATRTDAAIGTPYKPLEKRDLMLICTLGPRPPPPPHMKHVCV